MTSDPSPFHLLFLSELTSSKTTLGNYILPEDNALLGISDPAAALKVLTDLDVVVGFHPDGATEPAIDLALLLR